MVALRVCISSVRRPTYQPLAHARGPIFGVLAFRLFDEKEGVYDRVGRYPSATSSIRKAPVTSSPSYGGKGIRWREKGGICLLFLLISTE